ncbi:MAG: hypothetical protein Kow00121_35400 [Elainellaceae cyanobacterium]
MSKARIFYFTLQDEQTKEEKLDWFEHTQFETIPFDHITPDQKANWINLTDNILEWILDQYKEKKPKDPTIAKLFNTYKFADYKEQVINLLDRVCTVSVRTMEIIQQMPDTMEHQGETP